MEVLVKAELPGLALHASLSFPEQANFIGVSGPSGAGKSSLLRCLAGLNKKASVSGCWGGPLPGKARVGLVFQDSLLFPHLSVGQNLLLAADFARQQIYHFDEVVLGCQCSHLMTRMPDSLSGGEAQRVAIARALLNSPDILLLDEPVSAMDSKLKHSVLRYLSSLAAKGLRVLMVSHDLRELALYCEYMAWLERGAMIHQGRAGEVIAAITEEASEFEFPFSVLKGHLSATLSAHACYEISCEHYHIYARHPYIEGNNATLTVDARDVSIDREAALSSSIVNSIPCSVEHVSEPREGQVMVTLKAGHQRLFALISQLSQDRLGFTPGEAVTARFKLR
ncbi:ATP-binding cassette domain-containing protein [Aestuariibacter sp. A3R04]|uniref:ATP-binding cassette domain-containing protein n=1 Tax=Aestuariibacter sp. A3R04 TaxID=2841571 RepID=UPI001C08A957|nr:ATP-binding cassette domain-containing protein [Aestuariibacter sp. A3R04]MBU3023188.1 ATP-binding cassette domain-containing protein [Aestuariibacter sp. A3R04]